MGAPQYTQDRWWAEAKQKKKSLSSFSSEIEKNSVNSFIQKRFALTLKICEFAAKRFDADIVAQWPP